MTTCGAATTSDARVRRIPDVQAAVRAEPVTTWPRTDDSTWWKCQLLTTTTSICP